VGLALDSDALDDWRYAKEALMGSHDKHDDRTCRVPNPIPIIMFCLAVAAVVKELRTAPEQRTWNGVLVGFVPYDLRLPTLERIKERVWAPGTARLIGPRVFGVGWTLNVGRVVALFKDALERTR
jgi:hypothetical protein